MLNRKYHDAIKDLKIAEETYKSFRGTKKEKEAHEAVAEMREIVKQYAMAVDLQNAIVAIHPQATKMRKLIGKLTSGDGKTRAKAYADAIKISL